VGQRRCRRPPRWVLGCFVTITTIAHSLLGFGIVPAASAQNGPDIVATVPTVITLEVTKFTDDMLRLQEETGTSIARSLSASDPAPSSAQRITDLHSAMATITAQGNRVGTLTTILRRLSLPAPLQPRLAKLLRQAASLRAELVAEGRARDPFTRLDKNLQDASAFEDRLSALQDAATAKLNATGMSAVALQAASRSSMRSTAKVTVSITLGAEGSSQLHAQAKGVASLRSNAVSLDLSYSSPPELANATLTERIVNGKFYVGARQISEVVPHASWVRLPFKQWSAGSLDGVTNPLTQLAPSFGQGATVKLIGPDTIDGTRSAVYGLTTSRSTTIVQLRRAHLPEWETRSIEATIPAKGVPSEFWVDSSNHLIQVVAGLPIPVPGGAAAVANMTLKLSHYGVDVAIREPPAGSVVSYEQYQKALRLSSAMPAVSI
jgi:hypothetical protein